MKPEVILHRAVKSISIRPHALSIHQVNQLLKAIEIAASTAYGISQEPELAKLLRYVGAARICIKRFDKTHPPGTGKKKS